MADRLPLSLEEKQRILFEILKDIDAFCRENNITYSISDGTLLGAVRHGGFIPWDDDADICMLREDFDKFLSTYRSNRFQLLHKTSGKDEFFYGGYIKINDPLTVSGNPDKHNLVKHGVTVDIFPFDGIPEDEVTRKEYMHGVRRIDNRLYHSQKTDLLSRFKSRKHDIEGWWQILNDTVHSNKYNDSIYVGQSVCVHDDRIVLPRALFENISDISFNGYPLRAFTDTHGYLSFVFGPDYMTPRVWAHNDIVYRK